VANCPQPIKCHNCGEEGHSSLECTKPAVEHTYIGGTCQRAYTCFSML
jgi:hypothetical protein